ncbi:hypothetical protein JW935_10020 [candidate division KSB1 bacterium]|nr:hypothetical protein [candidate division KSB1 bacterium]
MKSLGVSNPAPDMQWELWYQDVFDRECPRRVEVIGRGLMLGLTELWARHLFETVQADGEKGFSRFNLWCTKEEKSIKVTGTWGGMVRLRKWIFGDKRNVYKNFIEEGDEGLLVKIARVHSLLVLAGQTSEGILKAAENCTSCEDFEAQLQILA